MPSGYPSSISRHLEAQFYQKIKYNFKLHVLLCLKGSNCSRNDVFEKIYELEGYRCHRVAKYGSNWSHLHIKFNDEEKAIAAVGFFKSEGSELTAVLVDDLLKDWYSFEVRSNYRPPYTHAIIDVLGKTPRFLNFLTPRILNSILEDFGRPFLLPYTAALAETHVQVLFSSMTEALAASMAFGKWYRKGLKSDQFHYRVRINPSTKEALLIKISGGVPEEAFKLDYFLNQRRIHRPSAGLVSGSEASPKGGKSAFRVTDRPAVKMSGESVKTMKHKVPGKTMKALDVARSKKPQEMVRPKQVKSSSSRTKFRSPIIYIPIITPVINPVAPLSTTDSLHTAAFPKGLDKAVQFQRKIPETGFYGFANWVEALASGMTKGLVTFDNVQQDAQRRSEVDLSNSIQQMTVQTMPCDEVTPDYYCDAVLAFEGQNYTI